MTTAARRGSGWSRHAVSLLCLLALGAFLLWPISLTIIGGLQEVAPDGSRSWTARYVLGVFADPVTATSLVNSLGVALSVTILCVVLAVPLALISTRYDYPLKRAAEALILVPLILPPFVGAIGLRHLLGRFGAINSGLAQMGIGSPEDPVDFLGGARLVGIVIIEVLHLYPIVYLNVAAALANIDPSLEKAADNLGASPFQKLRRITLPLIQPGLFAGSTIVFIWSFAELGTPLMFDYYRVAPVQIFWGLQDMADNPRPYALVLVVLTIALTIYGLGKTLFARETRMASSRALVGRPTKRLDGMRGWWLTLPFVAVIGAAVLPHLSVVLASLSEPGTWYRSVLPETFTARHFGGALTHPLASRAIHNSLVYSGLATGLALVLGVTVAYLTVRARGKFTAVLDLVAMMPLAVPGLVLAFGYVAVSVSWPFPQLAGSLDEMGLTGLASVFRIKGQAPNPLLFIVIAYGARRLPYVVRAVAAGLDQTSGELELAAINLGASRLQAIRRIVVPLIMANLIAGALLTFSLSMLEVSDSLILAETESGFPLTKAIYVLFRRLGDGPYIASALGVWAMALMTVTLVGASAMLGSKLGAVFRM